MAQDDKPGVGYGEPKQFVFDYGEMSALFDLLDKALEADSERYESFNGFGTICIGIWINDARS